MLLNFRQEVSTLLAGNDSSIADDCSDVLLRLPGNGNGDDLAFLGHNEDNTLDTVNTTYFVQAKLVMFHTGSCAMVERAVRRGAWQQI